MNWSFRFARVAGIDIKIHITFFLILGLGAWQWGSRFGMAGVMFGILLMILLFVCVTLHELGHSVVAQRFGVPVREIVLLPLGGVALMTRNPSRPLHELLIAAAGPLVNVVIALVLFVATGMANPLAVLNGDGLVASQQPALSFGLLLGWLLAANVSLVLFNLIPAFPLDGGRMLRAVLAMVTSQQRATRIAASIGQLLAIGLGVYGFLSGNIVLMLVALFVFFGAGQEQVATQARTVLETRRVGDAYNKHALTLQVGDRVSKVADYILTSYQPDFAVLQGGQLLGIVTRDDVLRALASTPADAYVTSIMQRDFVRVEAQNTLEAARTTMAERGARVAAVYAAGDYLGLVSLDDIAEAFAIIAFQQRQNLDRQPTPIA
ncbi:MAG TPA: site-2 protease family protein [Kouleothrix sp.]|uniref:site-2 protease family protein n=1 Tax=Kouleothrix sp. TaxID=2779161 RepID=UPI002D1C15A1|nr:site-2 protease family protein [Kouleothrix sp.]HRC75277.1 site-2 protease family protein [Kouleothrix sp.]